MAQTKLTLSNLCDGNLEEAFQALYPEVLAKCMSGDSGSLTITIDMKRLEDTASVVVTTFKIKSRAPGIGKSSLCMMDSNYRLETEEPAAKKVPASLFAIEGGQN